MANSCNNHEDDWSRQGKGRQLGIRRRTFVAGIGISPLLAIGQGHALQATPESGEPLPPEVLFERLRDTPVTTPLFPSNLAEIMILPWEDGNDDDLDGVVGGLLVQAEAPEGPVLLGVYIVHPTVAMAEERIRRDSGGDVNQIDLLGRPGVWEQASDDEMSNPSLLLGVVDGVTIVSALAEGEDAGANDLRALSIRTGMLDHLRMASTPA
jgi:hypothetical protein